MASAAHAARRRPTRSAASAEHLLSGPGFCEVSGRFAGVFSSSSSPLPPLLWAVCHVARLHTARSGGEDGPERPGARRERFPHWVMLLSLRCAAALGAFVAPPAPAGRACPGPRYVSPSMHEVVWTPSIRGPEGEPTPRDLAFGPLGGYCDSLDQVVRRKTRTVEAGPVRFGSEHRIVRQTMATTLTSDVDATVEQVPSAVVGSACVRAWGAGGGRAGAGIGARMDCTPPPPLPSPL